MVLNRSSFYYQYIKARLWRRKGGSGGIGKTELTGGKICVRCKLDEWAWMTWKYQPSSNTLYLIGSVSFCPFVVLGHRPSLVVP